MAPPAARDISAQHEVDRQFEVDRLFQLGQEAATTYQHPLAERYLRRALRRLDGGAVSEVTRARVLLSLANVRAERGHLAEGLEMLQALAGEPSLQGLVHSQRGLMLLRSGRLAEALAELDLAVPLVAEQARPYVIALSNRGMLHLGRGDLPAARADLEQARDHALRHELPLYAGRAAFNLAYLSLLAGDLPTALTRLDRARVELHDAGDDGIEAVYRLDRARILHASGLLTEADGELALAIEGFAAQRSRQDQGECELARALIALTRAAYPEAQRYARAARRRFARRGSTNWELVARLAELRAELNLARSRVRRESLAADAEALAGQLHRAGLAEDARMARLVAVRAHLLARRPERAKPLLVAAGRRGPAAASGRAEDGIVTRLYARQATAEYRFATGTPGLARRELVAGLRDLHRYQASFGSLDLQTAVARHGRALAGRGLAEALADGRPAEVFAWSERARAMASRLPPVRPPEDPEAARLLEELRYVRTEQRSAELAGRDDPDLRRRRAELEAQVRERSWYAPGSGEIAEPARLTHLRAALGEHEGATLVVHLALEDRLHALVVGPRHEVVVPLGPVEPVVQAVRRLQADLDLLALARVPEPIRRSAQGSVARSLALLQARLWDPLAAATGDGPLLLVPSGSLVATPWSMLPALVGRPVAVARSATAWLAARSGTVVDPAARVVLAAGPELDRAVEEVDAAAACWMHPTTFTGAAARGADVLEAADGADVVHLAAHGAHEASNPLFAALRMADGPLFGYDLARLQTAPQVVVLSACNLGLVSERPGEEVLGMAAALLHLGTGTVVASVARLADDVACAVTTALHRRLRAGDSVCAALAHAAAAGPDTGPDDRAGHGLGGLGVPLVAFGRGW